MFLGEELIEGLFEADEEMTFIFIMGAALMFFGSSLDD